MKKWIALLSAFLPTLSCATAELSGTARTTILSFDANPTTGYSWVGFALDGDAVQTGMLCGDGGQTQYVVTAVKPGRSIPPADARHEAESVQPSSFAEMSGLSAFLSRVTDDNPIVSVSFADGYSGLAPEHSTDSPDEIQRILDAVLAMEIGDVSDMYVTDWDPVLRMTCADGRCWTVAFNGHWLSKDGVNYNLIHDEELWKLTARLRQSSDSAE